MKFLFTASIALLLLYACNNGSGQPKVQARDTSINPINAHTSLFFDSSSMESYIRENRVADSFANRIRDFYNGRNYQFAWFDSSGLAEYASSFLDARSQFISYSGDTSLQHSRLDAIRDSILSDTIPFQPDIKRKLEIELLLTDQFFHYALKAYQGDHSEDAHDLGWFIPRKKLDPVSLIDSLINDRQNRGISAYEPVNRQYRLLRDKLADLYKLEKLPWDSLELDKKSYKPGDSGTLVLAIKKRLSVLGDISTVDNSEFYDSTLLAGVLRFQRRHGLSEDGAIGPNMMSAINAPIRERIRQILINMERIRWVPVEPPQDYLLVNIPAFRVFVYSGSQLDWSMRVVVGTVAHNTVIFRGDMKYIVFSPYWNVPNSILKNEILPAINRDRNYLAKHNMEWNGNMVRQKPGRNNALGLVKFLFPNSYNIYLHDTPSKSLFAQTNRAFSHGCIRLEDPARLAEYLLRNDSSWTKEKIREAMQSGTEKYVTLKKTIPVFIGYFTAYVDSEGLLNFRNDIYGHDKKMERLMFP